LDRCFAGFLGILENRQKPLRHPLRHLGGPNVSARDDSIWPWRRQTPSANRTLDFRCFRTETGSGRRKDATKCTDFSRTTEPWEDALAEYQSEAAELHAGLRPQQTNPHATVAELWTLFRCSSTRFRPHWAQFGLAWHSSASAGPVWP